MFGQWQEPLAGPYPWPAAMVRSDPCGPRPAMAATAVHAACAPVHTLLHKRRLRAAAAAAAGCMYGGTAASREGCRVHVHVTPALGAAVRSPCVCWPPPGLGRHHKPLLWQANALKAISSAMHRGDNQGSGTVPDMHGGTYSNVSAHASVSQAPRNSQTTGAPALCRTRLATLAVTWPCCSGACLSCLLADHTRFLAAHHTRFIATAVK
jgi:hypothetical protein